MNKSIRLFLPISAALIAAAASIPPPETALRLDPAQTKVEFTLGDVLHTVHGTFQLKRGDLRFDPDSGRLSGELVVDATSGDSGSRARDRRMHKSVLESDRYPEIVFRPDRVDGKVAAEGVSQVQLHGTFAIHGQEHEITMPAEVLPGEGQYAVTVKFTAPYVKWGMKNPSTLFLRVSDQVVITVHTTAKVAR